MLRDMPASCDPVAGKSVSEGPASADKSIKDKYKRDKMVMTFNNNYELKIDATFIVGVHTDVFRSMNKAKKRPKCNE